MHISVRKSLLAVGVAGLVAGAGFAGVVAAGTDFGVKQEFRLAARSEKLFGVSKPIGESSTAQVSMEDALANPLKLVTLARGLEARVVTGGVTGADAASPNIDMMVLWTDDEGQEYLIACNEEGTDTPGLQRINVATGEVATMLTGTDSCDPVHITPWGTIFFGEEAGGGATGGQMYELIDPLNTTGVTLERAHLLEDGTYVAATFTDDDPDDGSDEAANFAARPALGNLSYEGVAAYPNGVVYYGDENRPSEGTPGGAYFKFVPATLRDPDAGTITDLSESPFAQGSVYGLRLGLRSEATDYGQGTQTGLGTWVPVSPDPTVPFLDLRAQAAALKLTGYYRPEDLAIDLAAFDDANIRMCGNNTGNEESDQNWGETICLTDGTIAAAAANTAVPEVQYLVMGSPSINMPDNIAYQPVTGNWVLHEDGDTTFGGDHNNDLWDCLDDGQDDNLQGDGCIRIGTLNDLTAEWTGGFFDDTGQRFFVSVQHNITGAGLVIEITGWHLHGPGIRALEGN
jgi:hypothetical protein